MLLPCIQAASGKMWVEKVKQQLTASLTTTLKLPLGKGLAVISPYCFGGAALCPVAEDDYCKCAKQDGKEQSMLGRPSLDKAGERL